MSASNQVRELFCDTATGKVGEERPSPYPAADRDDGDEQVFLRPPGGGIEWIAKRKNLQPVRADGADQS